MFEDYAAGMGAAYDEMFDGCELRTPYSELQPSLQQMGQGELQTRVEALQSSYLDQGVTFDIGGEERAFPLDVLPRVLAIAGSSAGTLAVVAVAVLTIRRRPLANALVVAAVAAAATASALTQTAVSMAAACFALAAGLLYAGANR